MEIHNIAPVYDKKAKVLILGSFPSVKSREGQFFYHHPQNRFWKVTAAVFDCKEPETIEEKKQMLLSHHAAVWDVIASCDIVGSSDSTIKNVVVNDIGRLLRETEIERIYTNGGTAHKYYQKYLCKPLDKEDIMLPSTSPANAAWSLERLTAVWREKLLWKE
ncbi:MAG: DNA-deoxyinosine glycosylase [Bacillus sp. (in: Bacteria)]|nr:DNA-deoxyinosine glycosylase [Bacillus sp. (in: firmicutes)]MCM1425298.1 DNA-deoxyinosine glycosylase [Eubacterium sp.]